MPARRSTPRAADVRRAARALRKLPGVIAVYRGHRLKDGEWRDTDCLSVHVRQKRSRRELKTGARVPSVVAGLRTDVVEVGELQAFALGRNDEIVTRDGAPFGPRTGLLGCVAAGDEIHLLVSGHAALPPVENRIVRDFRGEGRAVHVDVLDYDGESLVARVRAGAFGRRRAVDWAVVSLDADGVDVESVDPWTGRRAPLPYCELRPDIGTRVLHQTVVRGRAQAVEGIVRLHEAGVPPVFRLPDGTDEPYGPLIVVAATNTPTFARPGDSGSLVMDESRRAVGVVVGGNPGSPLTYVSEIRRMRDTMPARWFGLFFEENR